jgi:hypothetical protein
MRFTYTDGAGNKYVLAGSKIEYIPMTPKMSSSITYSGGDPYNKDLSKLELIKLIDAYEQAIWSKEDHISQRVMGSGTLSKKLGEDTNQVLIRQNSESMKKINKALKTIS